jgi:hypothetical protein
MAARQVKALFEFKGEQATDLSFPVGAIIDVVDAPPNEEWWTGRIDARVGEFPANYTQPYTAPPGAAAGAPLASRTVSAPAPTPAAVSTPKPAVAAAPAALREPMVVAAPPASSVRPAAASIAAPASVSMYAVKPAGTIAATAPALGHTASAPTPAPPAAKVATPTAAAAAAAAAQQWAVALYDFVPESDVELGFQAGQRLRVLQKLDEEWGLGLLNGKQGEFPLAYVVMDAPNTASTAASTTATTAASMAAGSAAAGGASRPTAGFDLKVKTAAAAAATNQTRAAATAASSIKAPAPAPAAASAKAIADAFSGLDFGNPDPPLQVSNQPAKRTTAAAATAAATATAATPRSPLATTSTFNTAGSTVSKAASDPSAAARQAADLFNSPLPPRAPQALQFDASPAPASTPSKAPAPTVAPTPAPAPVAAPAPAPVMVVAATIRVAVAQYDFTGESEGELNFKQGDVLQVLPPPVASAAEDPDWLYGSFNGVTGYMPRAYVVVQVIQVPGAPIPAAPAPAPAAATTTTTTTTTTNAGRSRRTAGPAQSTAVAPASSSSQRDFDDEKLADETGQSFSVQRAAAGAINTLQLEGVASPTPNIPSRFLDRFEPIWRLPVAAQLLAVDSVNPKLTDGQLDVEFESLVPSITFIAELLSGIECSMAVCNEAAWDVRNNLQDALCVGRAGVLCVRAVCV